MTGPPTLQLFETNESPKDAASAAVVEIIRVGVSNPKDTEASLQAWGKISRFLASKEGFQAHVTYGKSLNLEEEIVVGIIGWLSFDVRSENLLLKVQDVILTCPGSHSNVPRGGIRRCFEYAEVPWGCLEYNCWY